MSAAKITISIDEQLLNRLDMLVPSHIFSSRSQAVQASIQERSRLGQTRLAQACANLDLVEEQALADEGVAAAL